MFKILQLIIGGSLFFSGVTHDLNTFGLIMTMVGAFIISRPFALDSGFGNTPALFLIGMLFFIPSFFLTRHYLDGFGFYPLTVEVTRITACLVTSVIAFLSICKR